MVSVITAPPEQVAELEGNDRKRGYKGILQGVTHNYHPLPQTLGPRRADVVLAEDVEQASAGHARNHGHGNGPQGQGRQKEVPQHVAAGRKITLREGVDYVEIGNRLKVDMRAQAAGHRKKAARKRPTAIPASGPAKIREWKCQPWPRSC